ncbi:MAG TPA: oligosaccharide flippase family protein [Candidatus Acidoferrales bacterium]|nr:oligosaccharide flippase family protein [Candidatus Acidoferrales bacterium]
MSEVTGHLKAAAPHQHAAFFRQSGWLMIASVGGGGLFYLVHLLSKKISVAEYGAFGVMLAVAMCVPNLPLQMVFAQQTARALATGRERALAGMIRLAWLGTFGLALLLTAAVAIWHRQILASWKLPNELGMWITLAVVLLCFWLPMFLGLLQGQQNFFWLGWVNILNALGRLAVAATLVLYFGGASTQMILGAAVGLAIAVGIGIWQSRALWRLRPEPFDVRELLGQIVPLMLGFGAVQFLFTADTMFVKAYFSPDDSGFYVGAGTLSRALLWLVLPLATVMFPKIVHSAARSEKSDLLGLVMLATIILAAGGAIGLTVLGPFLVRLAFTPSYVPVACAVLPWYAWAMVPLSLANVLVSNLLARLRFGIVPVLIVLAVAYGLALTHFHDSLVTVLKTLGTFNVLLLAASLWFTWRDRGVPRGANPL